MAGLELFQEGSTARDVFLLTEGLILLTYSATQGENESALGLRFPGQIIEQCAHVLETPYPVSARAILNCQFLRISASELRKRELHDPDVARFFQRTLSSDLFRAALFIVHLKSATPAERLNRLLYILAAIMETPPVSGRLPIHMPLTDQQTAEILGVSARHLKRVKKEMQEQGFLRFSGGRVWSIPRAQKPPSNPRTDSFQHSRTDS